MTIIIIIIGAAIGMALEFGFGVTFPAVFWGIGVVTGITVMAITLPR